MPETTTSGQDQDGTDFVAELVDAYTRAEIGAERLSETGVRVLLPNADPYETDYAEAVERARDFPVEQYPQMADEVVRATTRMFRERGVLLGTHYPLRSGDVPRHALVDAFRELGVDAQFSAPQILSVPLPDGDRVTSDVGGYLSSVEDASPEKTAEEAAGFSRAVAQQLAEVEQQKNASPAQLRVRLYPESMFPEGVVERLVAREIVPGLWQTAAVDHPESVQPLSRVDQERSGRSEDEVYAEAVANSVAEPVETSRHEIDGVTLVHIGGRHPFVAAQAHVLDRHLEEIPHGALVAFPVPQVLLAHPLGQAHPIAAMERLQELADRFTEDGDKPISSHLYWWHPASRERGPGQAPDLRPVRVEVDHEAKSVSLHADGEFGALVETLMAG